MDKYSRLLVTFKTVDTNKKNHPSLIDDLKILVSPTDDLKKLIKDDLHIILPAILILSVDEDVNIRNAVVSTFETFINILQENTSLKCEQIWKDMEKNVIIRLISPRLVKLVELNAEPWPDIWVFATSLGMHEAHSKVLNELLKVVEMAFKMSKKCQNDLIMERAYYCWSKLITIVSKKTISSKLLELLLRPLSAPNNTSYRIAEVKVKTWKHLLNEIGYSCGSRSKIVIESFIETNFFKGKDWLCPSVFKYALEIYAEILDHQKIYKYCPLKVLSAFPVCYDCCETENENLLIKAWAGILGNISVVEDTNRNEYILEIFKVFHNVIQRNKTVLNKGLMKKFVENKLFNVENLKICFTSPLPLISMFMEFMKYDDFRSESMPFIVQDLMDNYPDEEIKKPQKNLDLQIWDLLCDLYSLWIKTDLLCFSSVDSSTVSSLLMIPITYKQWSVPIQKTWYNLLDIAHSTQAGAEFISNLLEKIGNALKESQVSAAQCVDICAHITKTSEEAYKLVIPALTVASNYLPPKDPKPLGDLLVILENAVNFVPKEDLVKFVNDIMMVRNMYEYPNCVRIRTKMIKVQRKVYSKKDTSGTDQESGEQPNADNLTEQPGAVKTRSSPIMAHSNFLHRLAKAEEKKKKKCPSMGSLFGDSVTSNSTLNNTVIEKSTLTRSPSPISSMENEIIPDSNVEDRQVIPEPIVNGICSPLIPNNVRIISTNRTKSAQSKSPEIISSSTSNINKKPYPLKTPAPPTYFEDDAQDYVFVPPKAKTTPLTEHQKELLSTRKTDIPALYQDLSQDTLSDSQSIKEIIILKENESNNVAEDVPSICMKSPSSNNNISLGVDETIKSEKSDDKNINNSSKLISNKEQTIKNGILNKIPFEKSSLKLNISSCPDDAKDTTDPLKNPLSDFDGKSKLESSMGNNGQSRSPNFSVNEKPEKDFSSEGSQEIIDDTPTCEPAVCLQLTPTKQHGTPTPRKIISRKNMFDLNENSDNSSQKSSSVDEEEAELEKENISKNSKQANEKTSLARRSLRRNSGKPNSMRGIGKNESITNTPGVLSVEHKVSDENIVENKTNLKFESTAVKTVFNLMQDNQGDQIVTDQCKTLVTENVHNEKSKTTIVSSDIKENEEDISKGGVIDVTIVETPTESLGSELNILSSTEPALPSFNSKNDTPHPTETTANSICSNLIENEVTCKSSEHKLDQQATLDKSNDRQVLVPNDENSENVSDWTITTPAKKRGRKKKSSADNNTSLISNFSPKQLRSKKLSLSKNLKALEQSEKKMRKSAPPQTTVKKSDSINGNDHASLAESTDSESSMISPSSEMSDILPKTRARKRKIMAEGNNDIDEKKKKLESNKEDVNQDSVLVVKNNIKHRKKKIVKSILKQSPSNLDMWLLKTGKTIVKTSLISQQNNETETTNIKDLPEVQINVGESNNIVVEIPPNSNPKENPKITIVGASPEGPSDSEDPHNTTVISSPCSLNLSSDDDSSSTLNECKNDVPMERLQCTEPEGPQSSTPLSDSDSVGFRNLRRKRRLLREQTPNRETGDPSEEESFQAKKERLTTPHRAGLTKSCRSAQMVRMVTADEDQEVNNTPRGRRSSTPRFILSENWPLGKLENWIPCVPSPPGKSPSLGILRRKQQLAASPSSSSVRRRRVSFLDPPVITGLLYCKTDEALGQIQHANIPPGERPVWRGEDDGNTKTQETSPPSNSADAGTPTNKNCKEQLPAGLQELLNSTPDAPWSNPPEMDVKKIAGLEFCSEPIDVLLCRLTDGAEERDRLHREFKRLNITKVADIHSLSVKNLKTLSSKFVKFKFIANIIEEYIKELISGIQEKKHTWPTTKEHSAGPSSTKHSPESSSAEPMVSPSSAEHSGEPSSAEPSGEPTTSKHSGEPSSTELSADSKAGLSSEEHSGESRCSEPMVGWSSVESIAQPCIIETQILHSPTLASAGISTFSHTENPSALEPSAEHLTSPSTSSVEAESDNCSVMESPTHTILSASSKTGLGDNDAIEQNLEDLAAEPVGETEVQKKVRQDRVDTDSDQLVKERDLPQHVVIARTLVNKDHGSIKPVEEVDENRKREKIMEIVHIINENPDLDFTDPAFIKVFAPLVNNDFFANIFKYKTTNPEKHDPH